MLLTIVSSIYVGTYNYYCEEKSRIDAEYYAKEIDMCTKENYKK